MFFRFLSNSVDGRVRNFPIEAADFHAAFREFALKHWDADWHGEFGVWEGPRLIAKVFTGIVLSKKTISPLYNWVEPQGLPQGLERPGEN